MEDFIKNFNFLCKYVSGSNLYGVATENSDKDIVGVYIDKISNISKYRVLIPNSDKSLMIDERFYELRTLVKLINHGNLFALEPLFIKNNYFLTRKNEWDKLINLNKSFLDSINLFNWINSYCEIEYKWMASPTRENCSTVNAILQERFDKFGYDFSCACHIIMTFWKGIWFFNDNEFIYNIKNKNENIANLVLNIKNNPSYLNIDSLNNMYYELKNNLENSFKNRKNNYIINKNIQSIIINEFYQ